MLQIDIKKILCQTDIALQILIKSLLSVTVIEVSQKAKNSDKV